MSIDLDLSNIALIVDRPGATPAPTAGDPPTRPGDGPWKPGGPCVDDGYIDTTPANLGLDDDPVAHALHALSKFGELTLREARILLAQWARRDQLTDAQVAEVLAYYQPASGWRRAA